MSLLVLFTILSVINVVFSTIRTIILIKGNKTIASLISGGYYAFYNIVLVYTVANFPMWQKCLITFLANVLGVFIVKLIEEKTRKDKLWIFQVTAKENNNTIINIHKALKEMGIACVYNEIVKDTLYSMQVFSYTQKESDMIKSVLNNYNVKYCAVETERV